MKKLVYIFFLLSTTVFAQNRENIKISHGPYLCDMSTNAVSVVWVTDKPALSWVELAPDSDDHFYGAERPKFYETIAGRRKANDTVHHVRITGLEQGTKYRYRIFSQEITDWTFSNWITYGQVASTSVYRKAPLTFRTFSNIKDDLSFLMVNDIHGKAAFMKDLIKDVDFKSADFVLLNGDMSNTVENQEQIFGDYIDTLISVFATEVPIVFARGNHEARGKFADQLFRYFPNQSGNYYYMFNIGDVAFLVLDGGEDKPNTDIEYGGIADYDRYREEQADWLKKTIEQDAFKKAKIRIVFLHIPPNVGNWHVQYHLQKTLVPILNASNIDLMLSGHTHRYSFNQPNDVVNFPIVINSNDEYAFCNIKDNKISIKIAGLNKKGAKTLEIPVKPKN